MCLVGVTEATMSKSAMKKAKRAAKNKKNAAAAPVKAEPAVVSE